MSFCPPSAHVQAIGVVLQSISVGCVALLVHARSARHLNTGCTACGGQLSWGWPEAMAPLSCATRTNPRHIMSRSRMKQHAAQCLVRPAPQQRPRAGLRYECSPQPTRVGIHAAHRQQLGSRRATPRQAHSQLRATRAAAASGAPPLSGRLASLRTRTRPKTQQ